MVKQTTPLPPFRQLPFAVYGKLISTDYGLLKSGASHTICLNKHIKRDSFLADEKDNLENLILDIQFFVNEKKEIIIYIKKRSEF